ncbi:MAG: Gfo/Idh/MocA family oxidoreductase [Bryobacterales bacterium]|nr:Gfo/Idh/MocA family oxidoreductase [Bryobacterales bacterium]
MTTRRTFILAAAGSAAPAFLSGASVNERLTVGMMGFRGRGRGLLNGFADMPDVTVKTICDVDQRLFDRSVAEVSDRQGRAPGVESDFRRLLDDPDIDIVVMGTPTHWHAIPTVLACQAGKHVYVEKPAGHNIAEGRAMLDAARKHDRVVQVGIQSRSGTNYEEACEYIRSGVLGKVAFAKGWESARQRGIGYPPDEPVPDGVDYEMWLGPAPKRPFNRNRFHGSWRWFFDYGAGDLGNDGVHRVDYARRGLAAGFEAMGRTLPDWPTAVSAAGGKLFFDDAQEWPDTLVVTWDYPGATLMYEMRNWQPNPIDGEAEGAAVYGENGYVVIGNGSWRAFDEHHRIVARGASTKNDDDARHKRDMLNAIRDGGRPACDIEIGHCASGLVHLGNIAWRTDRKLRFDPETETFGDDEANRMLGRKYRKPWILPDV